MFCPSVDLEVTPVPESYGESSDPETSSDSEDDVSIGKKKTKRLAESGEEAKVP